MLIARAKRKENIVEYLLYMYQIEDIIRSLNLDLGLIQQLIVDGFDQPEEIKSQIMQWYVNLTESMIKEGKKGNGHLQFLIDEVKTLQAFHDKLLAVYQDKEYQKKYDEAKPILKDLVMKSGGKQLINEIDVAVNGLYGFLVLRLKKAEISEATESGIQKIKDFLAYLAYQFKQKEEGNLVIKSNGN